MSQGTSENKKQTGEAADSGQPGGNSTGEHPAVPVSTTVRTRPTSARPRQAVNRTGDGKLVVRQKSHGVEIAMAMVLGALVLGIVLVFVVTSSTTPGKSRPTVQADLPPPLVGELSPQNAATANAVVSKVANQALGTAVPLPPTPSGTPISSMLETDGSNWPMAGGNPARTRATGAQLTFPLKKVWASQIGGELQSSPAIANGMAYFGSSNGNFYAVDLATGAVRWQRQYTPIASSPAVAGNLVYFGTVAGQIYALDATTGNQRWNFPAVDQVLSSPVVANGVVYVGGNLGMLWAIDAYTGQKRFNAQTGKVNIDGINTSPAIAEGLLAFGANNNMFYVVDTNRKPAPDYKWFVKPDDGTGILSSPAIADGTVYFATEAGKLYAYDLASGTKKWAADLGGPSRSSPAVANGVIYIGSSNKKVYAFNAKDGSKKWEFLTGDAVFSSPTITGDTLLIGSNDTHLYALDLDNGTKKWDYQTDDAIGSSPAVVNGRVYVTSYDGRIYAFGQ